MRWIDHGNDFYAAVTFNDLPQDQRIMIGWMGNWDYANSTPTDTWRGQQSIPRRLSLQTVDGRPTLISEPIDVSSLVTATTRVKPTKIAPGTHAVPAAGRSLLIETTLNQGTATAFGLDVRVGNGQRTRIGYDTTTGELYVDRTRAGRSDFSPIFPAVHRAKLPLDHGKLDADDLRRLLLGGGVQRRRARQHLRPGLPGSGQRSIYPAKLKPRQAPTWT